VNRQENTVSSARISTSGGPAIWVAGDWNGFFGLFTNVALNVIVLTGLCLGVVKLPDSIVFSRVLPALAIALPIGNLFYAWLAWQLAKREGRSDVTALPYGPSVPHMFIVVFLVMLPTYLKTNDPILAWQAGLAWAFIIGIIILLGAFVGPTIRKYTPRAAMLGALAGISIAFISMRPAALSWQVPWIAFVSLSIILVSWTARVRLPWGLPGGLAAVLVGTALGWLGTFTGLSPVMDPHAVVVALSKFGLHVPIPSADFLAGLSDIGPLLVVAVPLGIYNFTEGMNNVESASAAGDNFDLRRVLLADGVGALAGAVLGSPFPPAVYIGHPGWKSVGGRVGYSFATGIVIALVCFLGLTALLLAVVPLVAILPILLYIGLVIGAQAFETTPARHAPAVILAMLPNIASWAQSQIDGALSAAGTSAAKVGLDKLAGNGVIYHGLQLFGGGGTLAGLMLGAIAAFVIDRKFDRAALYAVAAAVLAFFGFINGTALAVGNSAPVAFGYLLIAAICVGLSRYPAAASLPLDDTPLAEEVPAE
jgi:AGZA family xanthine/uracil permease-like MFS transporter